MSITKSSSHVLQIREKITTGDEILEDISTANLAFIGNIDESVNKQSMLTPEHFLQSDDIWLQVR